MLLVQHYIHKSVAISAPFSHLTESADSNWTKSEFCMEGIHVILIRVSQSRNKWRPLLSRTCDMERRNAPAIRLRWWVREFAIHSLDKRAEMDMLSHKRTKDRFLQFKYLSIFIVVLMLTSVVNATSDLKIENIDFSTPVDQLPYEVSCFDQQANVPGAFYLAVDLCGNRTYRFFEYYCKSGEDCKYLSAITFYELPGGVKPVDEYGGPISHERIWGWSSLALSGDSSTDIVITRTLADTILLEIISYSLHGRKSGSTVIQAAIGSNIDAAGGWNAVLVNALAAVDVNSDGSKELIYSRSAKPDSAFQRGVVAYDLKNNKQLWFYPTADVVSPQDFHIISQSNGVPIFVFNTISCANAYSSNGMDSEHAYLIAINSTGRELWRNEVGDAFFYPTSVVADINGDGLAEILVTHRIEDKLGDEIMTVDCYNPFSGHLLKRSQEFVNRGAMILADEDSSLGKTSILVSGSAYGSEVITRFDSSLQITRSCSGANLISLTNITSDRRRDLLVMTHEGRFAILDHDFNLLGRTSGEPPSPSNSQQWQRSLVVPLWNNYLILSLIKKPYWKVFYSRYKWPMALIPAILIITFIVIKRSISIYLSLQGLPSVNSLDAAAIIVNQKRRIVYHNHHPVTSMLLGNGTKRWQKLSKSGLTRYPEIMEFLDESFREHFNISQEQFEIDSDAGLIRVWVSIHPRLDQDRRFRGKIIFVEDLGAQSNFRKVFLSDDMQRIVHGMKTRLSAISCGIGNMREDPALSEMAAMPRGEYHLSSLADQTNQIAQMCARILHYASNRKPRLELIDINIALELAIVSVIQQVRLLSPEIIVAKELQAGLPLLMIDGEQIGDVLQNLLSNAVRAVKDGGVITVRSRMACNLLEKPSVRMVEIEVQDTGTGIEREDLERIWDLGFSRSSSTGVGLALAKEIIRNHGGTISVESMVGKGSLFTVRIPVDFGGK